MILCLNRCITKWSKMKDVDHVDRHTTCWTAGGQCWPEMLAHSTRLRDYVRILNWLCWWLTFIPSSDNEISIAGKWNTYGYFCKITSIWKEKQNIYRPSSWVNAFCYTIKQNCCLLPNGFKPLARFFFQKMVNSNLAFSCLLQNNLWGGEMLFEIEKSRR